MKLIVQMAASIFLAATVTDVVGEDLSVREELALEVIELTTPDAMLDELVEQMSRQMRKQFEFKIECEAMRPAVEEFSREIIRSGVSIATSPEIRAEMVIGYAELFSEQELRDIAAFYRTSAGRKLIENLPELTQRQMATTQRTMTRIMQTMAERSANLDERLAESRAQCDAEAR